MIEEYITQAMITANDEAKNDPITYFNIFMVEEIGELLGLMKKEHYHKMNITKEMYIKELGDIMWGLAFGKSYVKGENQIDGFDYNNSLDNPTHKFIRSISNRLIEGLPLFVFTMELLGFMKHKGITLKEVLDSNIEKLRKRYPDGYSHKSCEERVDVSE